MDLIKLLWNLIHDERHKETVIYDTIEHDQNDTCFSYLQIGSYFVFFDISG